MSQGAEKLCVRSMKGRIRPCAVDMRSVVFSLAVFTGKQSVKRT